MELHFAKCVLTVKLTLPLHVSFNPALSCVSCRTVCFVHQDPVPGDQEEVKAAAVRRLQGGLLHKPGTAPNRLYNQLENCSFWWEKGKSM